MGPVEGLTQVFAVGVPGDTLCLKKSVGKKSECLTEFPIPDEGPIVFDCNKDYSAITDYMRDPECGGLHKFLPVSLVTSYEERITREYGCMHYYLSYLLNYCGCFDTFLPLSVISMT